MERNSNNSPHYVVRQGSAPRERPVQASGPMVREILEDRKTQMRFVIEPQPHPSCVKVGAGWHWHSRGQADECVWNSSAEALARSMATEGCPYGGAGDWLWVQEDAYIAPPNFVEWDSNLCNKVDYQGRPRIVGWVATMGADAIRCAKDYGVELTNAPFMRRWASRLTLEITGVRVQRLQDISEEGAIAEGIKRTGGGRYWLGGLHPVKGTHKVFGLATQAFADEWDQIHDDIAPWGSNPWVWVVEFKRLQLETITLQGAI